MIFLRRYGVLREAQTSLFLWMVLYENAVFLQNSSENCPLFSESQKTTDS